VTSFKSAPSVSLSRSCVVGSSCVVGLPSDIVSPKEEEEQVSEKLFRFTYTFIPVGWGEKGRGVKGPMCESECVCGRMMRGWRERRTLTQFRVCYPEGW
jgi:hypothetical protein